MISKPRRAVVFDLDGVLIESSPVHRHAFEQIFEPLGIRDFDYSKHAGKRTAQVIEAVLGDAGVAFAPEQVSDLSRKKSRLARERLALENPVPADCVPVLRALAAEYILGLASSGSRPSVELFLDANHCADLFQSVLTGSDVEQAKPHPEIYLRSFEMLGVAPGDAIVIEDAISGILSAQAAGAGAVIGVVGTCSPAQLRAAGVSDAVNTLSQLPEVLRSVYACANSR